MRIRRRLAAGTAAVFATLAVLSSAPAASAVTVDGHEVLPLQVIPTGTSPGRSGGLAVWNMIDSAANPVNPVAVSLPGICPSAVGATARVVISKPGDELAGRIAVTGGTFNDKPIHSWLRTRTSSGAAIPLDAGGLTSAFGIPIYPEGSSASMAGSPTDHLLKDYDTTYSLSWSCWEMPGAVEQLTPGAPLWKTSLKKISLAESKRLFPPDGRPGYYTLTPQIESAPAMPTGVMATRTPLSLKSSWNAVTALPALTGYKVFVTAGGTPVTGSPFSAAATATSLVVGALRTDTAYAVSVVATNALGDSPASIMATATPLPVILGTGAIISHVMVAATSGGTISMTVTASGADLGRAVDQTDRTRVASGTLGKVTVSDLRVAAQQTPWKVQATTAPSFQPTVGGAAGFSTTALGSTPTVTGAGVSAGPVQLAGTASMLRLLANGTGGASGTVDANLTLKVPVGIGVGTYRSVITIDLVKA